MNTAPLLLSAALLASLVGCASPGDAGGDGGGADACPFCNWDTTGPGDAGPGDRAAPGEDLDVGGDAPADLPGDPESADTGEDGGGPGPDGLPPEDVPEQPLTYEQYGPMTLSRKGILLNGQYVQWRFARLDYWKVPASQWERRLDLVAAAGFDGVTTAACWARHAPGTGPAEFTAGNLDLAAFLDLAAARGLRIWLLAGPWIGEGAPAGCIPPRLLASTAFSATPAQDGAVVPRESDGDFLAAAQDWLAALNAVVAPRQITVSGSAPVVFYQLEDSWDLHLFVKEADGLQMEAMEGIPVAVKQPAPGPYFAALRSAALAGGISVPILTALTGRLENGGRRVLGTGDAPGVLPAFRMDDADPREPLEARLAVLRDELRASALHGAVFSSAPGIVTGGHPGPTFLLRMLFGGADAVSVEGFDEGVPAAGMGTVHLDAVGVDVLPGLQGGRPVLDRADRPAGGALSPEGIPLRPWFMLRRHAPLLRRFAGAVGHWDHPLWWGSGGGDGPVEVLEPAVGAVGEPPQEPDATPAQGAVELFSDHFMEWYVAPPEAGATRTSYMMQAADGTILLPLLSLEGLEDGAGSGEREDLITKLVTGDQEIPRHSGLVVPSYDREGAVPPWRGWGSKLVVLEHPLGAGYPRLEYCSSHLLDIREFNTRLLLVTYGEPAVKSGGIWFTEPGELSLAAFPSLPQVEWNSLPGGGVHTDPGGRMAIQSQHSGTGALVLSLDSGKTLELLSTITEVAERLSFHKDPKGWDLGVSGFDVVEEVAAVAEGLAVTGSRRPGDRPFVLLVHAEPWAVTLDGEPLECSYEAPALLLTCPHEEPVPPAQPSPLAAFATRQEPAGTGPLDLGAEAHPEAFVEAGTAPRPAEDALVGVDHGILWYTTELLLGGAGQDAFLSVPAAGDLVSVFVNDLYAGSSMALGNRPLAAGDASAGLGAPGFRIPAGFFHAGSNRVALRVLVWGRADRDVPRLLSMVPLLKDELLPFASAVPHLAVPGLQPFGRRGAWGAVTLQVSGAGVPLGGPWIQSAGGGGREGRTRGLLEGWHQLAPGAEPPGWGGVQAPSAEVPLVLADGASQWVSASFDRGPWSAAGEGGIDLVLEGRSLAALAWVNGAFAGSWLSDPESASQGAHSAIQAGQVVRGLRVSPEWAGEDGAAPAGRLRLPADALLPAQNRISVLLLDLSPAGEGDLELSGIGTVAGQGTLTRMELAWNRDDGPDAGPVVWRQRTLTLLEEPAAGE